jgi:hypothetical protein
MNPLSDILPNVRSMATAVGSASREGKEGDFVQRNIEIYGHNAEHSSCCGEADYVNRPSHVRRFDGAVP